MWTSKDLDAKTLNVDVKIVKFDVEIMHLDVQIVNSDVQIMNLDRRLGGESNREIVSCRACVRARGSDA